MKGRLERLANYSELHSLVLQGATRLSALALPLLTVIGVRYFAPEALELTFFRTLTDTALLVATVKLGVDVYLPSCETTGNKVVVSSGYRTAYALVISTLFFSAIALYFVDRTWQVALAAAAVLCSLAIAEAGRLKGRFTTFYFLKAPSLYIGVLAVCLVGFSGLPVIVTAFCVVVAVAFAAWRRFETRKAEIEAASLAVGAVVSLLVVVFGWKEAAASRYFFAGDQLAELVMYSRFSLILTFPFMLRNARVPLVMRASPDPKSSEAIYQATRSGCKTNLLWAISTGALLSLYALIAEPENAAGVVALMCGSCVVVAFGNMNACLVFLRDYRALVQAHLVAIGIFLLALTAIEFVLDDERFLSVALASFAAQLTLGLRLRIALTNWQNTEAT